MKCDPAHPNTVAKYSTLPLSGTQMLLIWDKPIGYGYAFKVEVKYTTAVVEVIVGTMGFGNAKALVINQLEPSKMYSFLISHKCSPSGQYTPPQQVDGTTLAKG